MDGQHFDQLTRRLAARGSRRAVLRGIVAGASAGLLAVLGAGAQAPAGAAASSGACKAFCGAFDELGPGECRSECARCEGQGGTMCGLGFHDRPFCCPEGQTCIAQKMCCPLEQRCEIIPGVVDCCAAGTRCVEGSDGARTCQAA
jgi:hypothetical protein